MAKTTKQKSDRMADLLEELRENFSQEFIGLLFLLAGGWLLLTLRFAQPIPWLVQVTGWTAPIVAISLLLMGLILIIGERAGYWSPEAVVGAELLLLSLQAGTFAFNHSDTNWLPHFDGSDGGLIGWTIGSLLVSGLGQIPAIALIGLIGISGFILLLRYTPLIYIEFAFQTWTAQVFPALQILHQNWQMRREEQLDTNLPPRTHMPTANTNFVAAQELPIIDTSVDSNQSATISGASTFDANGSPSATKPPRSRNTKNGSAKAVSQKNQQKISVKKPNSSSPTRKSASARKPMRKVHELPSVELLHADSGEYGDADVRALGQLIEDTLEDFNVPVKVIHTESGPTVTQFGVEPQYLERAGQKRKIRVNRIVSLADDLALALEARAVRIEAPVPGRPYVGIEVPNRTKSNVGLRDIIDSKEMRKNGGMLGLGLGRDTAGLPVVMDLARAPHMLIAGATGAGKSVCINTIITSLLMQHGPESLQFIMVDPKMVELPGYNGIPHLIGNAITDVDQVMGMLTWLLLQMDDRYRLFKEVRARNIDTYNELARKQRKGRKNSAIRPLPYIVLIVDELADLMMTAADDIERQLCRLAQMARATGIHLILATQRPSTDVVTGLIKANFPTRIAFSVTSQIDSRVIMDTPGAERLLGYGDMLLMRSDDAKLKRVQGCYVSDVEINDVVDFWKAQFADPENEAAHRPSVPPWLGLLDKMDDEDELILDAIDVIRGLQSCHTSMLQRKLRIGYPKAARLMEQLEARGVVGPDLGSGRGRRVLMKTETEESEEEYETGEAELL